MTPKDKIKDIELSPCQFLQLLDDKEVVVSGVRITVPSAIDIGDEIDNDGKVDVDLRDDFERVFSAWWQEIENHLDFLQEDNDQDEEADEE